MLKSSYLYYIGCPMKRLLIILLLLPALMQAQGIITTIAGNGSDLSSGDGGPATAAGINPTECTFDKSGNLYFAECDSTIRKVNSAGIITTIAGVNSTGYNGDGIPATAAKLNSPSAIVVDDVGNIFFNDTRNYRVRKIDAATGIITTVVGNGILGTPVYGGPATATDFYCYGICVDKFGNLYLRVHMGVAKVDVSGMITLLTANNTHGYYAPYFSPVPAPAASIFPGSGICIDASGNIYLSYNFLPFGYSTSVAGIVRIDMSGMVSQFAGNGYEGYSGDGGQATNARIGGGSHLTIDHAGNLFFIDEYAIRMVNPSGVICTVAGNDPYGPIGEGGPATAAGLNPSGVTSDTSGNIYIADRGHNRIRKVTQPECGYVHIPDISAIGKLKEVTIYPNPAASELTISATEKMTTISITNLLGQAVYTHEYNTQQLQVDVAELPKGIYLIRINGTDVRKFLKE
jgi:hypothetical protein